MLRPWTLAFALLAAAAASGGGATARGADWGRYDMLIADAKKAMMTDPKAALAKAKAATVIAQEDAPRHQTALATGFWLEGEALNRLSKVKEARVLIDQAITLASGDGRTTKLDGDLALSLARIADNNGDVALTLKSYQKAHDIFAKLGEARSRSIALQGLGGIYDDAHDFDRAISYYHRASQVYSEDPALELSARNNTGFALLQLKRYGDATKDFMRALTLSKQLDSPFLSAHILTNLAAVYAKQHKFGDAERSANEALRLIGRNDEEGEAPFAWGVKAEIEYERGHLDAAAADLDRAFRGIDLKSTIAPYRDMHEIAYKVYSARGNSALALAHLEAFKRLDDQGRSLAASANLALMGAQFDFANQRFEIAQLKSTQLQRDISLRESRAATQRVIFAALLLAILALVAWIGWRHYTVSRHRNAIRRKNVELTQTLRERDVEIVRRTEVETQLRLAMKVAEQANRAKSHFLANMSHELRTPLNAIIGFSEILTSQTLGPMGSERYRNYASDISASGRSLLAVLNDILDMARLDAGNESLAEDDHALGDVIDDALFAFEGDKAMGKTFRFTRAKPDIWVHADAKRLRQVLTHLISNAVKFTGPDGVIAIATALAADGGVDLLVSDNGIGIPSERLSLVLEPFGQLENAYARSHGGVGLGLPIVRSLVELHGGSFSLAGNRDAGTTARVHLPASRVVTAPQERKAAVS